MAWCLEVHAHKPRSFGCVVINFSRPVNRRGWRGRASAAGARQEGHSHGGVEVG